MTVEPRLVAATELQLLRLRASVAAGHARIGWKLGMGDAERIGASPALGHLTSATCLAPGTVYYAATPVRLRADAEVAVELARDIDPDDELSAAREAIAAYAPALEIVDLGEPQPAEAVVAANIFHRAVTFGEARPHLAAETATVHVNGRFRDAGAVSADLEERLCAAARVLAAVGERLTAGDKIITGSVVQTAIRPGDTVVADFGALGCAELHIDSERDSGAVC